MSVDYAEVVRLARKGRRAEQRGAAAKGCMTVLIVGALNGLFAGWMLMLGAGVIHAEWIHQLPTIGFWWAVLIGWLLRSALTNAPGSKSTT